MLRELSAPEHNLDFPILPQGANAHLLAQGLRNAFDTTRHARSSGKGGDVDVGEGSNNRAGVQPRAAKGCDFPNFKGSYYLGRFPLVSTGFWTSDHLSERVRSARVLPGTRAGGTPSSNRR